MGYFPLADIIISQLPLILSLLATGALAGLLAGLLGVGGGIVIVPVLFTVLGALDVPLEVRMHVAVGTSLATIIPTSIASVLAHHRKGAVDWVLFWRWVPGLTVGVFAGTWLATTQLEGNALTLVFACVALIVAIDIAVRDRSGTDTDNQSDLSHLWFYRPLAGGIPALIGALSAMMGIGGGTLSVPFLNAAKYPIHRAVATSAGFGLIIAIPAAIGYVIGGWNIPGRPVASLGYINVMGFFLITAMTVLTAPVGSRLAHAMTPKALRLLFSGFLFLTAARILTAV